MRSKRSGWIAAALCLGAAAGSAETAEELVAKNLQARGGVEKIKSVQSMRMSGKMRLGNELLPTVLELKRPGKTRWEFTLDGQTAVQAFDGTTAWTVMPFAGQTEPQQMSSEESRDIELQADMDGPFVDSAAKGNTITLVGREKIEGDVETWHLKVTRKSGEAREVYLDAKTYLQVLTVSRRTVDGRSVEIRSRIGDYRPVEGLMLPHSFSAGASEVEETQSLEFEKIELNVPIEDSRFRIPKARSSRPQSPPAPTASGAGA